MLALGAAVQLSRRRCSPPAVRPDSTSPRPGARGPCVKSPLLHGALQSWAVHRWALRVFDLEFLKASSACVVKAGWAESCREGPGPRGPGRLIPPSDQCLSRLSPSGVPHPGQATLGALNLSFTPFSQSSFPSSVEVFQ